MTFVIILHGIICVMLCIIILMQAGRKGGLTEAFAGAESMLGTKTNSFMVRATTIFCVLFFMTSLGLAIYSSQKGKSLMSSAVVKPKVPDTSNALDQMNKDVEAAKTQADQSAAAAVENIPVAPATPEANPVASEGVVTLDQATTEPVPAPAAQ